WNVVGPVCESSDFLAKNASLDVHEDDLIAIKNAGAYGFVMSSNYNTRNRAPEIMVDGDQAFVVRKRETIQEQFASECLLPDA
ncbi:MAG: diaminopimelate decarboxylase, partial [Endozoicomonas sp.]